MSNETFEGFEDPNYGGGKYENFALKQDTSIIVRILPAMKTLRKRKDYTQFWYTHFWKGRDPRNGDKVRSHPILCIQEKDFNKGGMITKQCPLCEKRESVKKRIEKIEATGKVQGVADAKIRNATRPLQQWMKDHGHDGKYRLYVINRQGQLGVLRVPSTAMKKLRAEVKRLVQDGISPMGMKGIWWEFGRTGTGFNTDYTVAPYSKRNADGSSSLEFHVMDKSLAESALEVLPDFDEEQNRIRYTDEQLHQLAAMANDDPDEVNRILGIKSQGDEGDSDSDFNPEGDVAAEAAPALEDDAFGAEPAVAEEAVAEEEDEDAAVAAAEAAAAAAVAAAKAKAAAAKAAKAAPAPVVAAKPAVTKAAPAAKVATKAATPAFDPATASDEDFDNMFQ